MQAAIAPRGDARTFLTHFGGGLEDDRYVVETFRSLANSEIVPVQAGAGRAVQKAHRRTPGSRTVSAMRRTPASRRRRHGLRDRGGRAAR